MTSNENNQKEGKKERRKEGKKERRKEGKKERKKQPERKKMTQRKREGAGKGVTNEEKQTVLQEMTATPPLRNKRVNTAINLMRPPESRAEPP